MAEEPQPTQQDIEKMAQVAAAGQTAATAGADTAAAMKQERDRVGFAKLSDEDIDSIAERFNELNIAEFEKRGAFDPPPEPVAPPAQPTAPPPPGEQQPAELSPSPPPKRSFAHRFMGLE